MKKSNKEFKVGQQVRLIDNRDMMDGIIACGWNDSMEQYFGDIVTIQYVFDTGNLKHVRVKENGWSWDTRFLKVLKEKTTNINHEVERFDVEEEILPMNYALTRVIENGNVVVCFVKEFEKNREFKVIAVCDDRDTFDLNKGVEVCMYKALRKIADRNLKKY